MTQNQIAYQNAMTERAKQANEAYRVKEQAKHWQAEDYREDFLTPYRAAKLVKEVSELQSKRKQEVSQMWRNIVGAAIGLLTGTGGIGN